MRVRPAEPSDAAAMLAIYRPIVEHTVVSFELVAPSLDEFAARVRKYLDGWACLVAEHDGDLVGYAYGASRRERAAYGWSTETSAYVHPDARRMGVGTRLYQHLIAALAERGYCNAYAGITLPNEASVALHRVVGFRDIGRFPTIGWKFGAWHDVGWFHCNLRAGPPPGT